MAEAAEKQHRVRFAGTGWKREARGLNSRTQTLLYARGGAGQIRSQKVPVLPCANLDAVAIREMVQLVPQCTQIFERGFGTRNAVSMRQAARNRLEIDVVLKQDACQTLKTACVLEKRHIFELHDIDIVLVNLPVNQPVEIRIRKFPNRVRRN